MDPTCDPSFQRRSIQGAAPPHEAFTSSRCKQHNFQTSGLNAHSMGREEVDDVGLWELLNRVHLSNPLYPELVRQALG